MSVALPPGRYLVLGGPGGYLSLARAGSDLDYRKRWQVLARFKARAPFTSYGVYRAVERVWRF